MVRQFADASLSGPMNAALDKLRAVLPRDRQEHVERLARQTVIRGRMGNHANTDPAAQPWLLAVQRGVAQRRVLRLLYQGKARRDETQRDVEPLGVVFYDGAWYLVGWCRLRVDVRHFRVDRIRTLSILDEQFPARTDFSLSQHLEAWEDRSAMLPVRVWFSDVAQDRARRESYATLVEERRTEGGAEFSFTTWSLEWLARWLLSFGGNAEALSPPELRELVCDSLEKIARRYAVPVS
jgi:predicted DNA-binding transcriptional regulator YafY